MTNKSMQYLVIQGRAPQDGSEPAKALILCPAWMSATLVCAGITGRIIEMTDGSIVEQHVLPYEGGEEELLAEIRAEFEDEELPAALPVVGVAYQEAERKIGMPPEMAAPYSADAVVEGDLYKDVANATQLQDCDDAYRKGAQSMRDAINKTMCGLGMPEGAKPGQWVKEQQRNLDAWRDAAGAAELCVEYDESGMVRKIFTPEESGAASLRARLGMMEQTWNDVGALLAEFGITEKDNRLDWLRAQLSSVSQGEIMDSYQASQEDYSKLVAVMDEFRIPNTDEALAWDNPAWLRAQLKAAANANTVIATLRDDFTAAMDSVGKRDDTIEQLRLTLLKIKKQVKAAL